MGHRDGLNGAIEEQTSDAKIEKEFEWIHVEENEEKHHAGEEARGAIIEAVASAVLVVPVPNEREKEKAERESRKAAHRSYEIGKGLRHVERDHEKGECESEDRVAKRFQARYLASPQTKPDQIAGLNQARTTRHVRLTIRRESKRQEPKATGPIRLPPVDWLGRADVKIALSNLLEDL